MSGESVIALTVAAAQLGGDVGTSAYAYECDWPIVVYVAGERVGSLTYAEATRLFEKLCEVLTSPASDDFAWALLLDGPGSRAKRA